MKKYIAWLLILTIAAMGCLIGANYFQTDGGKITLQEGNIEVGSGENAEPIGNIHYKMYIPDGVSAEDPAPAVLLLHGYQNDHETCAAYCIELARRGIVAMAIDEYGHGSTDIGLMERGYVNHKVTVNYGEDSEADGTYVEIGGAKRYRLMMNFSNLSFFNDHYSKDSDGNSINDSSCGGVAAYAALSSFDFVDPSNMGVTGHSMGTWSSWTVAAAFSGSEIEPKCTVLQCGELFRDSVYDKQNIHFNNVLLLQAKYDEFSYFRDYENIVSDELLKSPLRTEFLGVSANEAQWNRVYGNYERGTARCIVLLMTNHRLTTHHSEGLAAAMNWFIESFRPTASKNSLDRMYAIGADDQIYMYKECLVLAAALLTIAAVVPLAFILLSAKPFSGIVQEGPSEERVKPSGKRFIGALVMILLGGASYPFMTQLGHGLLPLPENIFRMTIGNGFLSYYGLLIVIMLIMTMAGLRKEKKQGLNDRYLNLGLGTDGAPDRFGWGLFLRSFVLAALLMAYMYVIVLFAEKLFSLDLRFIWPFFKSFTGERFVQFCVYILIYVAFFVLNNSRAMAALHTEKTFSGGFFGCWLRHAVIMTGGIILIALLEYIPFFMDKGPGADLLFGSTFGGPFMSLLIVFLPQVLIFSVVATALYRKTRTVFPGAIISAMMACWIVTGGSSML
ncbi:MAG: hypothetical protein IJI56_06520 [Firmicutes bacterium]|nr:hypothetical protein [Bacillota bacterium]